MLVNKTARTGMPYKNVECVKAGTLHTKEKQELNTSDFIFQASERLNYK